MKLSIIIPVYNEEKTIITVLEKLSKIALKQNDYEVIVVDDGSTDNTRLKIQSAVRLTKIDNLQTIFSDRNYGKGYAVRKGIEKASGNYILIQDADLEYDPVYISKLLQTAGDNNIVVYGSRLDRLPNINSEERTPRFLLHYFGNRFLSLLTSILYGQWLTDMETGYKLIPKKSLEKITLASRGFDFEPEITAKLLKNGYKIIEVPIVTKPRGYKEGKKLNTFRDGLAAVKTLIKYRFTD